MRRADVVAAVALLSLLGTVYALTLRPGQDWGSDFSQYIAHARNIAEGRPYFETGYQVTFPDAAIHMPPFYPPMFPLLLAPVYARFGLNYTALKLVPQALFILAAVAYFVLARLRGLASWPAAIAAGAFALSGLVLSVKDLVLSDSAYLLFAGLALIAMVKWHEDPPLWSAFAVAALMLLAYGTRPVGISLLIAFLLDQAWRVRRFTSYNAAVTGVFAVGVVAYAITLYDSRSYGNQFGFTPLVYLQNALYYVRSPASLWAGTPSALRYAMYALTLPVALFAWVRRMRRPSVIEFYVAASILPLVLYSAGRSDRYLLPVAPLFFLYFLQGAGRRLAVAACLLLAIGAAFDVRGMQTGPYPKGVEQTTFVEACRFLRATAEPRSMLVSWNPRVLALYTSLRTAWYPETAEDTDFDSYLARIGARYVLVYADSEEDFKWLVPHLERQPSLFSLRFHNADFSVYQVASP